MESAISSNYHGVYSQVILQRNIKTLILLLIAVVGATGCQTLATKEESGVVIARRAQIRSSTAVVAADLIEVARGDVVDILDSDLDSNGERWYRVRARDIENTEGWIEARNVMTQEMLNHSKELAQEDKDIPAQATGQLRASTNLRLTPDRGGNDNIMMKLDSGSTFEIISWKRVPKPKSSETTESDDVARSGSVQQNTGRTKREPEEQREPEDENELWYKVRLAPSFSPAPAGWIYSKQVELTVPSDIIFYRTGREFVAWQRLDDDVNTNTAATKDKDVAKDAKPGNWVILEKSKSNELKKPDEPDFDHIYVVGFDKNDQKHYTAYRSSEELRGYLPLTVQGQGNNKTFTVRIQDESGQIKDLQFKIYRDSGGLLRVQPPAELSKDKRRR